MTLDDAAGLALTRAHADNTAGCCDGSGQVHHGSGALHYVTLCRDADCLERREREWAPRVRRGRGGIGVHLHQDIRVLQVLLDGGVTDPAALFAAMPSGTTHDVARAIQVLSPMALEEDEPDDGYEACSAPGRRGCGVCDACADWLHFAEDDR